MPYDSTKSPALTTTPNIPQEQPGTYLSTHPKPVFVKAPGCIYASLPGAARALLVWTSRLTQAAGQDLRRLLGVEGFNTKGFKCMYIRIHMYTYILFIHTHIHVCVCAHLLTCMHVCMYLFLHVLRVSVLAKQWVASKYYNPEKSCCSPICGSQKIVVAE